MQVAWSLVPTLMERPTLLHSMCQTGMLLPIYSGLGKLIFLFLSFPEQLGLCDRERRRVCTCRCRVSMPADWTFGRRRMTKVRTTWSRTIRTPPPPFVLLVYCGEKAGG